MINEISLCSIDHAFFLLHSRSLLVTFSIAETGTEKFKQRISLPILHPVTKNNPAVSHMGFSSDSANKL